MKAIIVQTTCAFKEEAKDIERKRMERYKKEIEQLKNKRVDYLD